MIDLEFGFQQLDFEELHMIKDTLNKEIENKAKLLFRGKKVLEKEIDKKLPKVIQQRTRAIDGFGE